MRYGWLRHFCASLLLLGLAAFAQTSSGSQPAPAAQSSSAPSPQKWSAWFYQTPPGWQGQATPAAMELTPQQSGPLNRMRLLAPEPMQGSLSDWFNNVIRREAGKYKSYHLNAMQQGTTAHGKPRVYLTGQSVNEQGQQLVISYEGLVSLDGQGLLLETQFDTLSSFRYLAAYGKFIGSIEPGTAAKPSQPHTAKRPSNQDAGQTPATRRHRENDQTNQPGAPTPQPPTAGEPLVQPKNP